MYYAIFRSEPVYTLNDLAQIGSHNQRTKKEYKSNPDIDLSKTKDNIEIVPLTEKYVKGFYNKTTEYRKEHDERMKTEREDRKKTFNQMLNSSKNVVADEMVFTATKGFFKDKSREDIIRWADTCMDFVYKDIGYTKEQILHATVHLDEATPHLHCVVIPLIKKFDKRTNTERYTISKKQYIKDKLHVSELQDKYHERLVKAGFDLERGIKGNSTEHLSVKEFKKVTRYYENKISRMNDNLNKTIDELDNKMQSSKNKLFDKKHIIVEKETLECMNNIINESKRINEFKPKVDSLFEEINNFSTNYKILEANNQSYKNEIDFLLLKNEKLVKEKETLSHILKTILAVIKDFFRNMLKFGNDVVKESTVEQIKTFYDKEYFNKRDIRYIAINTSEENKLFEYANIKEKNYNDFEL